MQTIGPPNGGATRKSPRTKPHGVSKPGLTPDARLRRGAALHVPRPPAWWLDTPRLLSLVAALVTVVNAGGPDPAGHGDDPAVRAQRLYEAARAAFLAAPTNATIAWQFGRACFDWAELATNNAQRIRIAEDGIMACRAAARSDTNLAAAPYYLGMNLGQVARAKRFSALGLLDDMRDAFADARRLDERFDEAGPDRNLGLLYRDAPGWPLSLGDRAKAEQHLARAAALSPDYPENLLNLIESRLRWRQSTLAAAEIRALAVLRPRARTVYSGEAWAQGWKDWDRRWLEVLRQAGKRGIATGTAPPGPTPVGTEGPGLDAGNEKAPP
jgi:hypothetical protein